MLDLVVLGHITRDRISKQSRLGGAASFCTLAGAQLGFRVGTVSRFERTFALAQPLYTDPLVEFRAIDDTRVTTFELNYHRSGRTLRLLEKAGPLDARHVPASWRKPNAVYLGPIAGECPWTLLDLFPGVPIVAGIQGNLRTTDATGAVIPALDPYLEPNAHRFAAVTFSEQDHPDADRLAQRLARTCPVVVLTRGSAGATLFVRGRRFLIPSTKAHEVDPTGAGDVFGVTLTLGLSRGVPAWKAAAVAAGAAARVVEGPGLGQLGLHARHIRTYLK